MATKRVIRLECLVDVGDEVGADRVGVGGVLQADGKGGDSVVERPAVSPVTGCGSVKCRFAVSGPLELEEAVCLGYQHHAVP
jgi:hypothetical protein